MKNPNFVIISFQAPKEVVVKLRKLHPRYGEVSDVLRLLLKSYVDTKVTIKR